MPRAAAAAARASSEPAPPRLRPHAARAAPAEAWGSVMHDLKSPLSVIRVYADLIAEQAARGEPARPDHLRNLADEIGLMETLLGGGAPPRSRPWWRPRAPPAPSWCACWAT